MIDQRIEGMIVAPRVMVVGVAVVREGLSGLTLASFHRSEDEAGTALRTMIDLVPLRLAPAEVWFAQNGNVRLWQQIPGCQ